MITAPTPKMPGCEWFFQGKAAKLRFTTSGFDPAIKPLVKLQTLRR
jgi:hypothetical protein